MFATTPKIITLNTPDFQVLMLHPLHYCDYFMFLLRFSIMFSGYSANPVTTVIESILWSFYDNYTVFLRKYAYLNASRRSNAI